MRKSKNKLKRFKSKTVEKKPSKPISEKDSRSLSKDVEQDGKESHVKSRPTLDKISKMEKMMT